MSHTPTIRRFATWLRYRNLSVQLKLFVRICKRTELRLILLIRADRQ
jgi:hypothetical protein